MSYQAQHPELVRLLALASERGLNQDNLENTIGVLRTRMGLSVEQAEAELIRNLKKELEG